MSRIDTILTYCVSLDPLGSRGQDGVRSQRVRKGKSVKDRGGGSRWRWRASDLSEDRTCGRPGAGENQAGGASEVTAALRTASRGSQGKG